MFRVPKKLNILLIALATLISAWDLYAADGPLKWSVLQELDHENGERPKIGETLQKHIDQTISIQGFMLPMDFSAREVSEFLLMPYIPACMHVPPPPSNQIIHVIMKEGRSVPASFFPVEVSGVLKVQENIDFESSFLMQGNALKELK